MKVIQSKDYELISLLNKHVHDLHVDLYPDYFKPYNKTEFTAFFKEMVEKDNVIFLVLEDHNVAIGFAMVEIKNHSETIFKKPYQSVYVHQISISNSKQNKGYGSKLMEEITNIATEKGINRIELDYWSNNEVAKNFYKKHNYTIQREQVYKEI